MHFDALPAPATLGKRFGHPRQTLSGHPRQHAPATLGNTLFAPRRPLTEPVAGTVIEAGGSKGEQRGKEE